jgi:anti-sigma factor RsiW
MKCLDYVEWIASELEGALSHERSRKLHTHLSQCSRCRSELLLQRRLAEALYEEPADELSPEFTARLMQRALSAAPVKTLIPIWPIVVAALATLAAVASAVWANQLGAFVAAIPVTKFFSPALAWMASATEGTFGRVGDLPRVEMPMGVPALGSLEKVLVSTLLSSVPLIWCFYQVYAFLRD